MKYRLEGFDHKDVSTIWFDADSDDGAIVSAKREIARMCQRCKARHPFKVLYLVRGQATDRVVVRLFGSMGTDNPDLVTEMRVCVGAPKGETFLLSEVDLSPSAYITPRSNT